MKTALGSDDVNGFPYQLTPLKTKKLLPIPAVNFTEPAPSIKKIFASLVKIYVTPDSFFLVKFRQIFEQTRLEHNSATELKVWSGGLNMKYWPQQLNFQVFCATQSCGISREVFDSGVELPEQIRTFYRFHVHFTVRLILFQTGGIQSVSALPGDPTFNPSGNKYDVASYKRICADFGIAPTSDFRFTGGKKHGLGNVYIGVTGHGATKKLNELYGSKYVIWLDHEILTDHGVFYPRALYNDLVFELTLTEANQVVIGTDPTKLKYKLTNIQLEYEMIRSQQLAEEAYSKYSSGKEFAYDHVHLEETIPFQKGSDSRLNIKVNAQRRSLKAILLLFTEPYNAGKRNSEKYVFPDLKKVKVTINGSPNMLYNEGIVTTDLWRVARRFFVH